MCGVIEWFVNWHYSRRWGWYDTRVKEIEHSLYVEGVFLKEGEEYQRQRAEEELDYLRARRKYYAIKLRLVRE